MKKNYSYKAYVSNNYKSHIGYVEHSLYTKLDNITFNNANNTYNSTDVFNNSEINKTHNVKKTYYNYNSDAFVNKHSTINTNYTYHIAKNSSLYNVIDNNYYTKKNLNTSTITNTITRHSHNNYEHNVIKTGTYTYKEH